MSRRFQDSASAAVVYDGCGGGYAQPERRSTFRGVCRRIFGVQPAHAVHRADATGATDRHGGTSGTAVLTALDGTGNLVRIGGIDTYDSRQVLMTLTSGQLTVIVPPGDGGGYIAGDPTCAGGDYWWEPFDNAQGTGAFESCGTWTGTVLESGTIEGTTNGSFGYYLNSGAHLFCRATDHRFKLVPR